MCLTEDGENATRAQILLSVVREGARTRNRMAPALISRLQLSATVLELSPDCGVGCHSAGFTISYVFRNFCSSCHDMCVNMIPNFEIMDCCVDAT